MMNDHKVITWPTARGLGWVDTQPFSDWYTSDGYATISDGGYTTSDFPLNEWSIKNIKRCLLMARLDTFGTKTVLVARLSSYLSIKYDCREPGHALDSTVRQAGEDKQ